MHETLLQAVHMQCSVSSALVGKTEENMQLSLARAVQQQEKLDQQEQQQLERGANDSQRNSARKHSTLSPAARGQVSPVSLQQPLQHTPLSPQQQPALKRFDLQSERKRLDLKGKEERPSTSSSTPRATATDSKRVGMQAASIASAAIAAAAVSSASATTPKAQKHIAGRYMPAHYFLMLIIYPSFLRHLI
jgi:hypothetical protein